MHKSQSENNGPTDSARPDKTVVFVDAEQSILHALGQKVPAVRRVMLRDEAHSDESVIVQPQSSEMPTGKSHSRYQMHGEIARGGMGAILKGRDTDLGRDLAIKVLLESH